MSELSDPVAAADGEVLVEVENVTKVYHLGELFTLQRMVFHQLRGSKSPFEPSRLPAVDDVTCNLRRGECVAVLGGNGSGKSTLLQMLAGITVPTRGAVRVRGRVLPLLEVGAGFHPELTGRENALLFGTVLGLPRREIVGSIDEVADFAGVSRHLDTPIKRYSQGMQARLSFALAMRFAADVYMFDEVLAVVDDSFRERCLDEIQRLVASGSGVIFVSHDLRQVMAVCSRAVWLDRGRVRASGSVEDVLPEYSDFHRASSHAA